MSECSTTESESEPTLEDLGVLLVGESGEISSVVEDHVEALSVREALDGLLHAPNVLLLGLSLPGEDGDAGGGDAVAEIQGQSFSEAL